MTDEQLEKFVKERYEERTAFEVRPDPCNLAASSEKLFASDVKRAHISY